MRLTSCDKVKQKWNISSPLMAVHYENTCLLPPKHLFPVTWGGLKDLFKFLSIPSCFGAALSQCVCRKVEKTAAGSMKCWTCPCCQGEVLLPISYGNQCNRMQSIAKQLTLALTATHKTVKNGGALAGAWQQREGINGVRNKGSVR